LRIAHSIAIDRPRETVFEFVTGECYPMEERSIRLSLLNWSAKEAVRGTTMVRRGELTDKAWDQIAPLLPENGRRGKHWKDRRDVRKRRRQSLFPVSGA